MPTGMGVPKAFSIPRRELRVPIEVGIQILSGPLRGEERTFTQNVSSRGARVWTARRWRKNERLTIAVAGGEFRSTARVAYCETIPGAGYAVGLELLDPRGKWIFETMNRN
jgi:hypothetical protein